MLKIYFELKEDIVLTYSHLFVELDSIRATCNANVSESCCLTAGFKNSNKQTGICLSECYIFTALLNCWTDFRLRFRRIPAAPRSHRPSSNPVLLHSCCSVCFKNDVKSLEFFKRKATALASLVLHVRKKKWTNGFRKFSVARETGDFSVSQPFM